MSRFERLQGRLAVGETRDARFEAALRRIPPERIDRLALYAPEDTVSVRFRVMEGGREAFQSRYHRIIPPTGTEH